MPKGTNFTLYKMVLNFCIRFFACSRRCCGPGLSTISGLAYPRFKPPRRSLSVFPTGQACTRSMANLTFFSCRRESCEGSGCISLSSSVPPRTDCRSWPLQIPCSFFHWIFSNGMYWQKSFFLEDSYAAPWLQALRTRRLSVQSSVRSAWKMRISRRLWDETQIFLILRGRRRTREESEEVLLAC